MQFLCRDAVYTLWTSTYAELQSQIIDLGFLCQYQRHVKRTGKLGT